MKLFLWARRSLLLPLIFVTAAQMIAATPARSRRGARKPVIIAYLFPQNALVQPEAIAARKLTRINYAFANIRNGRMVNGFAHDDENFRMMHALKRQNPALEILISVGGWTWSGNFSDMALTAASRRLFIESAVEFIRRNQLDGLDVDWEFPGQPGNGNRFRAADKQNYTALLRELRIRFNREERTLRRRLYLSVAAGASREFVARTQLARVQRYVDTINLMAYDYYEPADDRIAANHAPLYTNPADPKQISADRSVRAFERAGVPPHKIVLGVPFYGHVWGGVPGVDHGLFQPGSQVPNAHANYGDITTSMLGHGYLRYWDTASWVPYLYSETKQQFVSYEDPESLKLKCLYVRRHALRGVMFWEYSGDPSGVLLDTIYDSLLYARPAAMHR